MPEGTLLTYPELSRSFHLPGWMYFRCVQLRHAARAQFPSQPLLQLDTVETVLLQEGLQ